LRNVLIINERKRRRNKLKYSKEKVEAAKILFAEVLELNEELERAGSEKEIQFEINGGKFPSIIVRFWDWDSENNPVSTFEVSLERSDKSGRRYSIHALAVKVKDWRERFGDSRKED
jgi:hypothetical protein